MHSTRWSLWFSARNMVRKELGMPEAGLLLTPGILWLCDEKTPCAGERDANETVAFRATSGFADAIGSSSGSLLEEAVL